jgi:hypothetical protein
MKLRTHSFFLVLLLLVAPAAHAASSRLTVVDSSATSWVARGYEDYTVSTDLGWRFSVRRNFDNGVTFSIEGKPLPGTNVSNWGLDFAAPGDALLVPGKYFDFQRFPFQEISRPGLAFSSTGRLDNRAAGMFEVFEATYGPTGEVLTFSADFTHFGEELPGRFAIVELRFNVIPEPSTLLLLGAAVPFVFRRNRRVASA